MNNELTPRPDRSVVGGSLFPSAIERQTKREIERVVGQARISKLTEEARGHLANDALEIVGALSCMEAQLIQVAPLGEARYKLLVDSFTMGAANTIARFR